jgi:hypothetical protein
MFIMMQIKTEMNNTIYFLKKFSQNIYMSPVLI